MHRVVHAFVFAKLDFRNVLYTCISQASLHHHLVQNAAADIVIQENMTTQHRFSPRSIDSEGFWDFIDDF